MDERNLSAENWRVYTEHQKQAWKDIQDCSKSFERNLLVVSSGALGVSLAFVKDIVPLREAVWLGLLYTSWICFAVCIAMTVFCARFSIASQTKHLDYLYKFYVESKHEYFNKRSGYSIALSLCIWVAASLFLGGLACTLVFTIKNLEDIQP